MCHCATVIGDVTNFMVSSLSVKKCSVYIIGFKILPHICDGSCGLFGITGRLFVRPTNTI
jgi:hypothetical protein